METTERKLLLLQTVDFVLNGVSVCNLTGQEFQKSEDSLDEVNLTEKIADTIKTATGAAASAIVARPTRSILAEKCSAVNLTDDDLRLILSKWEKTGGMK